MRTLDPGVVVKERTAIVVCLAVSDCVAVGELSRHRLPAVGDRISDCVALGTAWVPRWEVG